MIKVYEKKVSKVTYWVLSKQIEERTSKKDVRVYPVYDKKKDICGIRVTLLNNKDDEMVKYTLRIRNAA